MTAICAFETFERRLESTLTGRCGTAGMEVGVVAKQLFALNVIGRAAFVMLAHRPGRPARQA
jgi:hypothetical protein